MACIDAQDYEAAYTLLDGLNYEDSKEKQESIKPKKMHDRINGKRKARMVVHDTMLTKLNIFGTTSAKYMPITA